MGLCCTGLATSPFCVVRVVRLRWDTGPQLAGQSRSCIFHATLLNYVLLTLTSLTYYILHGIHLFSREIISKVSNSKYIYLGLQGFIQLKFDNYYFYLLFTLIQVYLFNEIFFFIIYNLTSYIK